MANVIVLSSDEDDDAISLPIQEVERDLSYAAEEDFDFGASNSFDGFSTDLEDKPSTSSGTNRAGNCSSAVKRARVVHELSDSDDDSRRTKYLNNWKRESLSSDDDLPDIDVKLKTSASRSEREKFANTNLKINGKPDLADSKSPEPKQGKPQKREEQRLRKQLELADKAKQRQAKQEEREQKKKEAAREKQLKQVKAEIVRSKKKGECLKWISAIIDPGLLNTDYSGELITALRTSEIDYKVEECIIPCSVSWERRVQNVVVDDNMEVQKTTTVENENFVLIVWMWNKLITEVHEKTLPCTVEDIASMLPGKEITLVVFGLEEYFRYQKTQKRRDVRSEVLGTGPQKRKAKEGSVEAAPTVSRGDVEHVLAELQVFSNLNHRIINSKTDMANLICQFTKAIAEAPLKKEEHAKTAERLSWYALGDSADCVAVDKDGNGSFQLWQRQLCQFPLASRETSEAIATEYPSPLSLLLAYEKCSNEEEAQHLLENIAVRRGPGPLSSTRRIGPQLSKKIHTFFTTFDENTLISSD